jgi:hypothetical protein
LKKLDEILVHTDDIDECIKEFRRFKEDSSGSLEPGRKKSKTM